MGTYGRDDLIAGIVTGKGVFIIRWGRAYLMATAIVLATGLGVYLLRCKECFGQEEFLHNITQCNCYGNIDQNELKHLHTLFQNLIRNQCYNISKKRHKY